MATFGVSDIFLGNLNQGLPADDNRVVSIHGKSSQVQAVTDLINLILQHGPVDCHLNR
jgi:hypothetical protein